MKQEIVVADTDPKHWLKYKARSKPGLEGWTEPVPEESEAQDPIHVMSADELQQIVSTLLVSGGSSFRPAPIPRACSYHGLRGEGGEGLDHGVARHLRVAGEGEDRPPHPGIAPCSR